MSKVCRIFIVGDSLFTDTLRQLLATSEGIVIVGSAPDIDMASSHLMAYTPDLIVVADVGQADRSILGPLLSQHPDLPVICADLHHTYVQVITSQRISARREDLLVAIHTLAGSQDVS